MQIREWFGHFCRTVLRMYQQPYSHEWDAQLNQLLDQGTVAEACEYTLTLYYEGTYYTVWTRNRWFAFGHLYRISEDPDRQHSKTVPDADWRRPRFRTMQRLWSVYALHRRVFRG